MKCYVSLCILIHMKWCNSLIATCISILPYRVEYPAEINVSFWAVYLSKTKWLFKMTAQDFLCLKAN